MRYEGEKKSRKSAPPSEIKSLSPGQGEGGDEESGSGKPPLVPPNRDLGGDKKRSGGESPDLGGDKAEETPLSSPKPSLEGDKTEVEFRESVQELITLQAGELDKVADEVYRKYSWVSAAIGYCLPDIAQFGMEKGADGSAVSLVRHYLARQYADGEIQTHTDAVRSLAEAAQIILLLQAQNITHGQLVLLKKLVDKDGNTSLMGRESFDRFDRLGNANLKFMKCVNELQESSATSRAKRIEIGAVGTNGLEDVLLKAESSAEEMMGQSTCEFLLEGSPKRGKQDGVTGNIFDATATDLTEAEMRELRE